MPAVYQGTRLDGGAEPIANLQTPAEVGPARQQGKLELPGPAQSPPSPVAARPVRARRPDQELRAGLPHAGRGARGGRPGSARRPRPVASTAWTIRRPRRPDGSACWPAGWSSAACDSSRSTAAPAASGTPTADIEANHAKTCRAMDQPVAGLLKDLKRRGLLDQTLVVWGGEFGRTPMSEKGERPRPQPLPRCTCSCARSGSSAWARSSGSRPSSPTAASIRTSSRPSWPNRSWRRSSSWSAASRPPTTRPRAELLRDVLASDPNHVYNGLLTVLMRLVFILYAEDRGLLSNDPVYVNYYAVTGLFDRLRADAGRFPDTMDLRYGAWAQLLTLFRLVYEGGQSRRPPHPGAPWLPVRPRALPVPRGRGVVGWAEPAGHAVRPTGRRRHNRSPRRRRRRRSRPPTPSSRSPASPMASSSAS